MGKKRQPTREPEGDSAVDTTAETMAPDASGEATIAPEDDLPTLAPDAALDMAPTLGPEEGSGEDVTLAPEEAMSLDATVAPEDLLHHTLAALEPTVDPGQAGDAGASTSLLLTIPPSNYLRSDGFGAGGMGEIRRAIDRRLARPVLIKELHAGLQASAVQRRRFEREIMISAALQHPGIINVFEGGRWPSGEPFFAMQQVHGQDLQKRLSELASREARLAELSVLIDVANAMAYAHSRGVIHRDLKPANVLVGEFGETVIIDWGLAKLIGEPDLDGDSDDSEAHAANSGRESDSISGVESAVSGDLTQSGAVMGTPAYMPPEQALGEPVDERADVYAIGAMLYHLLAGVPPYEGDARGIIVRLTLGRLPTPLEERDPNIPLALRSIVDKAMQPDPDKRYASAGALADDLKRFNAGQLVGAHQYTLSERIKLWISQHKALVATALVALVVVISTVTFSFLQILSVNEDLTEQRDANARQRDDNARQRDALDTLSQDLEDRLRESRHAEGLAWLERARGLWQDARRFEATLMARQAIQSADGTPRLRPDTPEHIEAWTVIGGDTSRLLWRSPIHRQHPHFVTSLAHDGTLIASGSYDGTLAVWGPDHTRVHAFSFDTDARLSTVAIHAASRRLFASDGDAIAIYDLGQPDNSPPTHTFFPGSHANILELARDGSGVFLLNTTGDAGRVELWSLGSSTGDAPALTRAFTAPSAAVAFALSPDGSSLAAALADGSFALYDTQNTEPTRVFGAPETPLESPPLSPQLAFSPDATRLAASTNTRLTLYDLQTTSPVASLDTQARRDQCLTFAPDGQLFFCEGGALMLWSGRVGEAPSRTENPGLTFLFDALWTHDGLLVTTQVQGELGLFERRSDNTFVARAPLDNPVRAASFSNDGTALIYMSAGGALQRLALDTFQLSKLRDAPNRAVDFSLSSRDHIAFATEDGTILIQDLDTGRVLHSVDLTPPDAEDGAKPPSIDAILYAPLGSWLAARVDSTTHLWRVSPTTGALSEHRTWTSPFKSDACIAFTPDASRLLAPDPDSRDALISINLGPEEGEPETTLLPLKLKSDCFALQMGPRDRLAIKSLAEARVVDLSVPETPFTMWSQSAIWSVYHERTFTFSPSGAHLLLTDPEGEHVNAVHIGETSITESLPELPSGGRATLSPDGRLLALFGPDGVALWELSEAIAIGDLEEAFETATFQPGSDGRILAGLTYTATLSLYDTTTHIEHARLVVPTAQGHGSVIAFNEDASHLSLILEGKELLTWSLSAIMMPKKRPLLAEDAAVAMAPSPDGGWFTGHASGRVARWSADDAAVEPTALSMKAEGEDAPVVDVTRVGDRALVSVHEDCAIRVWDIDALTEPTAMVEAPACGREGWKQVRSSPDGVWVGVISPSVVYLWKLDDPSIDRRFRSKAGAPALLFSRDSRYAIVTEEDALRIVELETGVQHMRPFLRPVSFLELGPGASVIALGYLGFRQLPGLVPADSLPPASPGVSVVDSTLHWDSQAAHLEEPSTYPPPTRRQGLLASLQTPPGLARDEALLVTYWQAQGTTRSAVAASHALAALEAAGGLTPSASVLPATDRAVANMCLSRELLTDESSELACRVALSRAPSRTLHADCVLQAAGAFALSQLDLAEALSLRAVELDASDPEAFDLLAEIAETRGKNADARRWHGRAIDARLASAPAEATVERARALNEIAWVIGTEQNAAYHDLDRALQISLEAVTLKPGDPNYLDTLARMYFERGELEQALSRQREAVALAPEGKEGEVIRTTFVCYEAIRNQQREPESLSTCVEEGTQSGDAVIIDIDY